MKKLAPILISIIMIGYFSIYVSLFFLIEEPSGIGVLFLVVFGLIGVGFIGAIIYTLRSRLKEIDKEDPDDLSKY